MAITYSIYRESRALALCAYAYEKAVKVNKRPHATLAGALEDALSFAEDNQTNARVVETPETWNCAHPYICVWGSGNATFAPGMLATLLAEFRTDRTKGARAMECLAAM